MNDHHLNESGDLVVHETTQAPGTITNLQNMHIPGNLTFDKPIKPANKPSNTNKHMIKIDVEELKKLKDDSRNFFALKCAFGKAKEYSNGNKTTLIPLPLLDAYLRDCNAKGTEHFSMPSSSDLTLQNIILLVIIFAAFFVMFTKFNKN